MNVLQHEAISYTVLAHDSKFSVFCIPYFTVESIVFLHRTTHSPIRWQTFNETRL